MVGAVTIFCREKSCGVAINVAMSPGVTTADVDKICFSPSSSNSFFFCATAAAMFVCDDKPSVRHEVIWGGFYSWEKMLHDTAHESQAR